MNNSTRTITITSGKGGVGKTNISLNLALELSKNGYRTCVFDADLGLANINILLGLSPEKDLEDVIAGQCSLRDILIKDFQGLDIIPGSSGVEKIASLSQEELTNLTSSLNELNEYDYLIFDTSAGISPNTIAFCLASSEILLIITPEPTSMTDAYALLKILERNQFKGTARVVVNQCRDIKQAQIIYNRFKEAVNKYLSVNIQLAGIVVQDPNLIEAVKNQRPFLLNYPQTKAAGCIKHMAKILIGKSPPESDLKAISVFWDQCLSFMSGSNNKKEADKGTDESDLPLLESQDASPAEKQELKGITNQDGKEDKNFDALVKGILDISKELGWIRTILEEGKGLGRKKIAPPPVVENFKRLENVIELNFDDYYEKQLTITE